MGYLVHLIQACLSAIFVSFYKFGDGHSALDVSKAFHFELDSAAKIVGVLVHGPLSSHLGGELMRPSRANGQPLLLPLVHPLSMVGN